MNTKTEILNPFELKPHKWWLTKCRDLHFFCKHVLSKAWLDKFHDFGILHRMLCDFLMFSKTPSTKKLISIFRLAYKTTTLLGYVVWLFCWHLAMGKSMSIVYNTATKENANAFMEDFRQTLLECKFLHAIFPMLPTNAKKYRKWSAYRVEYKWVKFHVASLDTKQVSRHYNIIINDDLVNDDNAFSEKERDTIKRKWKFQKSIIEKYVKKTGSGFEIDVGTPYHPKDLMSWLIKDTKTYDKFLMPYAIKDDGTVADLKKRNGYLTMPEVYAWEDFDEKRHEQGKSIFASQYELRVLEEADKLCDEAWLKYWKFLPERYYRIMVIDPAGVKEGRSSSTGITICDSDQAENLYVVFADEFKISPMELIDKMRELKAIYKPDEIYIEKEKYSITIADTIEHLQQSLDFSFVENKNKGKDDRIHRLKQWFENGRILLGQNQDDLINQILEYPDCQSKDILDSLAYQIEVQYVPKSTHETEREAKPSSEEAFEDELKKIAYMEEAKRIRYDAYF